MPNRASDTFRYLEPGLDLEKFGEGGYLSNLTEVCVCASVVRTANPPHYAERGCWSWFPCRRIEGRVASTYGLFLFATRQGSPPLSQLRENTAPLFLGLGNSYLFSRRHILPAVGGGLSLFYRWGGGFNCSNILFSRSLGKIPKQI